MYGTARWQSVLCTTSNGMNKVIIYTTPFCAYCKMAEEYFKSKGIQYEEYNVMSDIPRREEMIKKSGQIGVPVIDINGKIILGFDKPKINECLGIK